MTYVRQWILSSIYDSGNFRWTIQNLYFGKKTHGGAYLAPDTENNIVVSSPLKYGWNIELTPDPNIVVYELLFFFFFLWHSHHIYKEFLVILPDVTGFSLPRILLLQTAFV
jgi:hypothetical protein